MRKKIIPNKATGNFPVPEKVIQETQKAQFFKKNGKMYKRIKYGDAPFDRGNPHYCTEPCPDCGVTKGQYHQFLCDIETCPRCDGQVLSCECNHRTVWEEIG